MKLVRSLSAPGVALLVVLYAVAAIAAGPSEPACRGAKLKAAGKYANAAFSCDAKAAKDGSTVDSACLSKGESKLDGSFASAESKNGSCNGLDVTMQAIVDDTVADVALAATVPSGGSTCVASVHKAAGKFASSFLGAWSKYATTADATTRDGAISKARTKMLEKIAKAESKGGCASADQGEPVRSAVEDGLAPLLDCLSTSDACIEEAADVPAGGSATTDSDGTGPTSDTPLTVEVETPNAGTIVMRIVDATDPPPAGYALLGHQVEITAPDATAGTPLVLSFVVDASLLPPDVNDVGITRDGVIVADCSGAPGVASPDPCIQSRTLTGGGDLEMIVLSSHASLWTPLISLGGGGSNCPSAMLLEMRADAVGDDRATEIDVGWRSAGHGFDPASGSPVTFALDCTATDPPCGTCSVTGFDPAAGTCRCANNTRVVCDEPGAADANDCGGSQCQCFLRVPTPTIVSGTSVCLASVATSDATGTWNVDTGSGSLDLVERVKVFLGSETLDPCPTCVGDTPGDGVANGTCSGGASNGLSCEAQASDPTFPYPSGGFYSIDCMPNGGSNITGPGMLVAHTETTGSVSLASGIPCVGNTGESCQCAVCSGDTSLACSSNAQCASAGAGTCTSAGSGVTAQPNDCFLNDCTAGVDGEAQCATSSGNMFCDGITEEDGRGVIACISDSDCDNFAEPGVTPGACTLTAPTACFLPTITATGVADPEEPRTVAATCVPPTSNSAVNSVFGLPGPGRVRTDWFATYLP